MRYSLAQIQVITGGQLSGPDLDHSISQIYFDTRKIAIPRNGLFICFVGHKRDGHDYIEQAIEKGIKHFIVERSIEDDKVSYLKVDSSINALQALARYHRSQLNLPIIGITGSNGKTIVKEWLYTILSEAYTVMRSPMSYNSQIGVALSVLQIDSNHDMAIIEAAIEKAGDMDGLEQMIKCQYGIFTNIGDAHQVGFHSIAHKIKEKLSLFSDSKSVLYCEDHSEIKKEIKSHNISTISWSQKAIEADYQINIDGTKMGSQITIQDHNTRTVYHTSITEKMSTENLMHCITFTTQYGMSPDQIQRGINKLKKLSLRLELKEGAHGNILIDDSYSFDIISLESALAFLQNHSSGKSKVLIISDILQYNAKAEAYGLLAELMTSHGIQSVIHIGQDADLLRPMLKSEVGFQSFESVDVCKAYLSTSPIKNAAILIKGARKFQFDRLASKLSRKLHQTELEVNLTAIRHNLNVMTRHLDSETKLLCVIKANAYGTGSTTIGHFLESIAVDYLAVAYTDEGIELRQSGVTLPILVLNPEVDQFDEIHAFQLEPEIYSLHQLRALCDTAIPLSEMGLHIKIDTGMNRLGFSEDDIEEVLRLISTYHLEVKSIMSHLAASDDSSKDVFTTGQLELFDTLSERIISGIASSPMRQILNTSGVTRFRDYQYDMVRIGKGMYGIDMTYEMDDQLTKVHRLYARVSQVKEVKAGSTIGYGCHIMLKEDKRIAIIGIGYADGLPRNIGNGKIKFKINEQLVPTIGNICMDMCMIDISHIGKVNVGNRVEIFGDHVDIRELAAAADTIPLEILSKLSKRLSKVYVED